MGLELEDSAAFEFLGRLPDRDITARGQRMADSALAAFVFAQRPGATVPPLAVQASEIAATRWAHESCLRPAEVQYNVHRPYSLLPDRVASLLPPALLRSVGLDRVSFPAIELCAVALPSDSRQRASCWYLARSHVTHHASHTTRLRPFVQVGGRAQTAAGTDLHAVGNHPGHHIRPALLGGPRLAGRAARLPAQCSAPSGLPVAVVGAAQPLGQATEPFVKAPALSTHRREE